MDCPEKPLRSIVTDEIGINTGRYGDYRIKTLYQPVYRRVDSLLMPVGVTCSWIPMIAWRKIESGRFWRGISPEEAVYLDDLGTALAVANFENIGIPSLHLFIDSGPVAWSDLNGIRCAAETLVERLDAAAIDRTHVTYRMPVGVADGSPELPALVAELRSMGLRIGMCNVGAAQSDITVIEGLEPDVVTVDSGFFGRVADVPETRHLFSVLLAGLQSSATMVQIDRLDTPELLIAALDGRADLLQGEQLAAPALAGTVFPKSAFPVAALSARTDNIAVLRR